ncbi:sigma-70 family RNA polymerase sigma factor [Rivularia sp. UHCC 0363]|uniref:sigma-70 family RNA polymerase sigma factor n=1 Tax=Rivularia sp. UHCC 0363 TaxID=3110244 RepID=UPI002B1F2613|nr:sigma-70 family RNA polymerase sigma factor [Rivularia sp. UHCC 0363]MEA5598766.1 sigma-70 family RNA polymerase sigma factor [Rivularia sp. UHCC 0363]
MPLQTAEPNEQLLIDSKYRQLVEKIARKHTRNSSMSWEDAAQTAHIKVFQAVKAGKFSIHQAHNFYCWAATVARNAVIDFVRKEGRSSCQSLDKIIAGTDVSLLDTVASELDLLDAVERADIVIVAKEAIIKLAQQYPDRGYLKLWQGMVEGKKQTQLAIDLKITQGEVSRRRKELLERVNQELGLVQPQDIKQQQNQVRHSKATRKPSQAQW